MGTTKKQKLVKKIIGELRRDYKVSAKDLQSGSFYNDWDSVQVEDVMPFFESQYGVVLVNQEFRNWLEFANVIADKVLNKIKTRKINAIP